MALIALLIISVQFTGCSRKSDTNQAQTTIDSKGNQTQTPTASGAKNETAYTQSTNSSIFSALADEDLAEATAIIQADPTAVNAKNENGYTPLAVIAFRQTMTFGISMGGALTRLSTAASNLPAPLVAELLIAKGADVNAKDKQGVTPLTFAILTQKPALAELLIAKGADVNAKDDHGGAPLLWAIGKQIPSVAKSLINKGADVNVVGNEQDSEGYTPLHYAALFDDFDTTTELLAAGAKINVKNRNGETPLFVAAKLGRYDIVNLLLQRRSIMDVLLQRRADVNAKDAMGRTPLTAVNAALRDLGKSKGSDAAAYKNVAALLEKNGGKE